MKRELTLIVDGEQVVVTVERDADAIVVERSGERHVVRVIGDRPIASSAETAAATGAAASGGARPAATGPRTAAPGVGAPPAASNSSDSSGIAVRSPMVGVVREIHVTTGDAVAAGDRVITMEAMKMDIYVNAPESGAITGISCAAGQSVSEGAILATIDGGPDAGAAGGAAT